jgi:hypothetical protein
MQLFFLKGTYFLLYCDAGWRLLPKEEYWGLRAVLSRDGDVSNVLFFSHDFQTFGGLSVGRNRPNVVTYGAGPHSRMQLGAQSLGEIQVATPRHISLG